MEFQLCDEQYNNENISYNSIIISLLIIYIIAIIVIIFFIKEPVQFIKEPVQFIKEPVQFIKEPVQFIKESNNEEDIKESNNEELSLANYNTKGRALALEEAYKEKLYILLQKRKEINEKLDNFNRSASNIFFNTNRCDLPESVVNKILLLRIIHVNISKSITKELPLNEEILRTAKKAGIFDSPYDILELLKINTNTFDTVKHPFYDDYKDELLKI
jgi:hypothetical protein